MSQACFSESQLKMITHFGGVWVAVILWESSHEWPTSTGHNVG